MAITVSGVTIQALSIDAPDPNSGQRKLTGAFHLLSTAGKVLAKQSLGGYGGIDYAPSPETQTLIDQLAAAVKFDVETMLGFNKAD